MSKNDVADSNVSHYAFAMVWLNFDWLKWNADQFCRRLDETAVPIYHITFRMFNEEKTKSQNEAHAPDAQLDEPDLSSYLNWIDEEWRTRRMALATMMFTLLAREITSYLDELLKVLGRKFKTDREIHGKSRLDRQCAEYHARFNIDIASGPHFEAVREIVLARNDALHSENTPGKEYLSQTGARFLDEASQINLTPDLLVQVAGELKIFSHWLADTLSDLAKRQHPE